MKKRIVLTGFMGVGKTTVGKQLAKRLGVGFFDMDEIIEKEEGMTVAEIFDRRGEDYFRKREAEVFKRLIDKDPVVISTGGGTFENADVRRLAKSVLQLWASTLLRKGKHRINALMIGISSLG